MAWNSSSLMHCMSQEHMDLVPLTCTLIALPLASAFSLPGSTPAPQQHRNPHPVDTRPATGSLPTTQPSSSHRGTGERTTSHGCMLELSSGRPSTSADMRDAQPVHTGPSSHERPAISGGQPQMSGGAPQQQQQTTSHSQQPTHPSSSDQMGSYRAPQPMPTSSYQSGAHNMHMQQMMQAAAAAYHTMQGMQQQMGQQQMTQPFGQQGGSMSYGSGYNPYMMGPYGPMADPSADPYAAQQQMYRNLAGAQGGGGGNNPHNGSNHHQSSHDGGDDDDAGARAIKRPRLVWTPQLHKRFEEAIAKLGDAKAVPKNIMQEMNVEGLTRENVASHLQKYRLQNKGSGSLLDAPDDKTSQ